MKKVLVLIYTPTYGGPHNQVTRLYRPLLDRGWQTLALLPEADPESYQKITEHGIPVLQKPLKRLRASNVVSNNLDYFASFKKNVEDIKEVIVRKSVDVVQVCGLMHIHAAFACRELGIPLVWQLLGTFAPLPMRALYTPFVAGRADVVMTAGSRTAEKHPFHSLFSRKHIVFYPPVDTDTFTFTESKRAEARERLGVPDDAFLVGTVGNQNKTKGHEYFVEIADRLLQRMEIHFRVVGAHTPSHADYYREEVLERVRSKGLRKSGRFDIREDILSIDKIMAAFDLFLLTSRIEGMPTVVLEAMSMGLPVISSRVGSVDEVVRDGVNGYLYDLKKIQKAVHYIEKLAADPGLAERMGAENRRAALEKFDRSVCADRHVQAYERACKMERLLL